MLGAALEPSAHPAFSEAITSCLGRSYCHIIVDESFDMNLLDTRVIEHAIDAGVTVTLVGDPWQSLYEFRGASPCLLYTSPSPPDRTRSRMPSSALQTK